MAELDQVKNKDILKMINQNDENLKKLHDIVRKSFEQEKLIVDNLSILQMITSIEGSLFQIRLPDLVGAGHLF